MSDTDELFDLMRQRDDLVVIVNRINGDIQIIKAGIAAGDKSEKTQKRLAVVIYRFHDAGAALSKINGRIKEINILEARRLFEAGRRQRNKPIKGGRHA